MKWIIIITGLLCFSSLKDDGTQLVFPLSEDSFSDTLDVKQAQALIMQNCYSCHTPEMNSQPRIAPPIQMVRSHYIRDYTKEEDFVAAISDWVKAPDSQKSIMPGALNRFGLMPQMRISDEIVREIAAYLYRTDMTSMHGSSGHGKHQQGNIGHGMQNNAQNGQQRKTNAAADTTVPAAIIQQGQEYVNKVQSTLASNLLKAIERSGTDGAVNFCSTRAIALTDSAASELGIYIKRVTDRPRNQDNLADPDESAYLLRAKATLAAGKSIQPAFVKEGDSWRGYYPIITNPLCMNCHGAVDKDIDPATLEVIREQYPQDKATGYTVPEVRGAWVVSFSDQ